MKRGVILGIVTFMTVSATYTMPVHAEEGTVGSILGSVGVSEVLELDKTTEEFMEAAGPVELYGYSNIGIANVDNHLNVRETPDESGKLVGKMSRNAACEILGTEGE